MSSSKSTQKTLVMAQLGVLSALIIVFTFVPYVGYINYGGLSITLLHIPVIIGAVVMGPKWGTVLGGVWGVTCIIRAVFAPPSPLEGIIFRNPLIALIPRMLVGLVAGSLFGLLSKRSKSAKGARGKTASIAISALISGVVFAVTFCITELFELPEQLNTMISSNRTIALIVEILLSLIVGVLYYLLSRDDKKNSIGMGITTAVATAVNTVLVMGGIYLFYSSEVGVSSISLGGLTKFVLAAFSINAVLEIIIGIVLVIPICLALKKVKTRI
ncbi:MAG: ECF transporter S component [Clostridiales bacterium]|nr:ECF transporter S component [Clostridiales bacterium]